MSLEDVRDKDATSNEDILKECKARFQICESAEGQNRQAALDDLNFGDGAQWPDDIRNTRAGRPCPVVNHTNTFVRRVVNNLRELRPRIKCHPVGDGARIEDAEVINGLIRHIETLSNASVAYDNGVESAVRIGWGYWRVMGDYVDDKSFDQELKIAMIRNTFTVYMDPGAIMPAGEDQKWCILSGKMKRIEYKALYPHANNTEWQPTTTGDNDNSWEDKEEIRLAEYYRIRMKPTKLYLMNDGSTRFKDELPDPDTMAAANYQIVQERDSQKRTVEWFRINGDQIVERRELPGQYIPVIRCQGNVTDVQGEVRRKGMIRDLKDPARTFNYMTASKIERLMLTPKAPWVLAEGQIDGHPEWYQANQQNYSTLVYKSVLDATGTALVPPPMRQEPAPVEAGFAEAAQSAEHDLVAIAGMPHEPGQDTKGEVVSGVALQRRQAVSDMSHYQYFDNETLAIAHTGRILLELIPYYYDTPRMQRIIGDDGVPQMVGINQPQIDPQTQAIQTIKNDLTVGRYDVVMDTGPGYETKRQEGAEAMLGLLGTPLGEVITKVGPDLVVRNMDFAGANDLADRLATTTPEGMEKAVQGLPKQGQAIVNALQAQLKEAQTAVQHLQLELKYKTGIEHGWMHLEREKAHMADTTKRFDTEIKATKDIQVAEIKAGAELLNTHVEAKHNKEEAEIMLKAATKAEKSKPN